jgi:hypothetical protein
MKWMNWLSICLALCAVSATPVLATNIQGIVELNGDSGATYIPTQWTGQTFTVTTAGVPYLNSAVGDQVTVPYFVPAASPPAQPYTPGAYTDRHHSWANGGTFFGLTYPALQSYLVGGEYIMPPQGLRDNATLELQVTVASPSTVYLLIDNRLGEAVTGGNGQPLDPPTFDASHMAWVAANGWTPVLTGANHLNDNTIPDEVAMDENQDLLQGGTPNPNAGFTNTVDSFFSVYAKQVPAGTFSLFQANKDPGNLNMYGVVITPEPASATLMLLAVSAVAGLRRKR